MARPMRVGTTRAREVAAEKSFLSKASEACYRVHPWLPLFLSRVLVGHPRVTIASAAASVQSVGLGSSDRWATLRVVDQCRASTHKFASASDQWSKLIYQDTARESTLMSPSFVQSYLFGRPKEGVEAVA